MRVAGVLRMTRAWTVTSTGSRTRTSMAWRVDRNGCLDLEQRAGQAEVQYLDALLSSSRAAMWVPDMRT